LLVYLEDIYAVLRSNAPLGPARDLIARIRDDARDHALQSGISSSATVRVFDKVTASLDIAKNVPGRGVARGWSLRSPAWAGLVSWRLLPHPASPSHAANTVVQSTEYGMGG
jgi:hypothetical protein